MGLEIQAAIRLAKAAGEKILHNEFASGTASDSGAEKDDLTVEHHAIVTPADIGAQAFIVTELAREFPRAKFIVEEKSDVFKDRII